MKDFWKSMMDILRLIKSIDVISFEVVKIFLSDGLYFEFKRLGGIETIGGGDYLFGRKVGIWSELSDVEWLVKVSPKWVEVPEPTNDHIYIVGSEPIQVSYDY